MTHHGESVSVWFKDAHMPECISLKEDFRTDVCIVGGGIAGLTTAYLLMLEGKKVCVLEASELASGQTGKTTAHFTHALDDRFFFIEKYHGEEGLKLSIESHSEAIRKVEEIVRKENIDCDLKRISGYLFAENDEREDVLEREFEAAHRGGLIDVKYLSTSPFNEFKTGPCLVFPKQVRLHPIKYLSALAQKIIDNGGQIFTNTAVVEIKGGEDAYVKTKDNSIIYCDSIVVATNTPINDMVAIHTKQAPYRTYVIGLKVDKGAFPDILLWDTLDPYHYIRLQESTDHDIVIIGGEDHKTGQNDDPKHCYAKLEAWARKKFSMLKEVVYEKSGQVMEPVDGVAYLGRNPMDEDNVYIITGDSGNGMTHATIGAMIINDLIMERENSWEKLYTPSRVSFMATKNYIQENANVALQYADWLTPKKDPDLKNLTEDEGVVFREGTKIIAAYKNINGELEYMSAVCPHLAGIVAWNAAEKSWDCPCHGSRFDCHGKVIEGPAISDLKKASFHDVSDAHILKKELQGRFDKNTLE